MQKVKFDQSVTMNSTAKRSTVTLPKYVCQRCDRIVPYDPKKDIRCENCGHRVIEKVATNAHIQHVCTH